MSSYQLISDYYAAFNAGRLDDMVNLLTENVKHYVNQGELRIGREKFREFNAHMETSYREELSDLVIMVSDNQKHAAAEFVVHGVYNETDPGLPEARGQRYELPAGAFFDIENGQIARVTTYYNLKEWIAQVS